MSQQNKTTLQAAINTQLADNTSNAISAADVRDNLINMTDSLLFNNGNQYLTGSFAHGLNASAQGNYSHAEGDSVSTPAQFSHAEGYYSVANSQYSHAEGNGTQAGGGSSHVEGYSSQTINLGITNLEAFAAHAEGEASTAYGDYSHAEGSQTVTYGLASHAEGLGTIASGSYQHVQGQYNTQGDSTSLMIVGNGTSTGARRDAFKVRMSGSIVLPTTQSAAPSWTGTDGEIIPATVSGKYLLYMWMNGAWRSGSFV